jgi:hypothetical protein
MTLRSFLSRLLSVIPGVKAAQAVKPDAMGYVRAFLQEHGNRHIIIEYKRNALGILTNLQQAEPLRATIDPLDSIAFLKDLYRTNPTTQPRHSFLECSRRWDQENEIEKDRDRLPVHH